MFSQWKVGLGQGPWWTDGSSRVEPQCCQSHGTFLSEVTAYVTQLKADSGWEERCFHLNNWKQSHSLSINTVITFPPALSVALHSSCYIPLSDSEDVGHFMIFHHLSRNKTMLGSCTVWPCCAWGGQVHPHVTTDFGGVTEISDPKYHPFPSSSLSLAMTLPLWWDLPIISLTTNALGKWPHLVVVAECSHIKTWSQIRCSSGVIPTSLCWL